MAAEYLKLFKYIEKKVQEWVEILAHSIQQTAQGLAACCAADFFMSQCPIFQFSELAITYLNKWSIYMVAILQWKEEKCSLHWNMGSHRVALHYYLQSFPGCVEMAMQ